MTDQVEPLAGTECDVDSDTGFLPATTPMAAFDSDAPSSLRTLEKLTQNLPELLENDRLTNALNDLGTPSRELFNPLSERELYYLYHIAGFLAHASIHGTDAPDTTTIPAGVAVPLYEATNRLGCTPVLSYDAYILHNWMRTDSKGVAPRDPHDVEPITTFSGLEDERWFIAIHVAIERTAGPALAIISDIQQGIREDDLTRITRALRVIGDTISAITAIIKRMPARNDPEVYEQHFRHYLGSFSNVEYEGVPELDGPQSFRGASGAQTSLFQAFDAALGIDHGDNPLINHLRTLRNDMPPTHRRFIESIEAGPTLHDYVETTAGETTADLQATYNECIDRMITFRKQHVEVVSKYVTTKSDSAEGTGGTPYSRYLDSFTDDTQKSKITNKRN